MGINTLFILAVIGLLAGILGGMVGIGGGMIIIPALVMFLGAGQKLAQGTSLAIMLPPIGILAAYNYYKAGYVDIKFAIVIAVTFIIGGWVGSKIAIALPELLVKRIFAGFMIVAAIKMLWDK